MFDAHWNVGRGTAITAARLTRVTLYFCHALFQTCSLRLRHVVDEISGHVVGSPRMTTVIMHEVTRVLAGCPRNLDSCSDGNSNTFLDGPDRIQDHLLQRLESCGIKMAPSSHKKEDGRPERKDRYFQEAIEDPQEG